MSKISVFPSRAVTEASTGTPAQEEQLSRPTVVVEAPAPTRRVGWVEGSILGKRYRIVRESLPGQPYAKQRPRFFELVENEFGEQVPRECAPPTLGEVLAELETFWAAAPPTKRTRRVTPS
jgi:hypothetical protein